jgi:hypothetical protein
LIFFDNIADSLLHANVITYADDTVIYFASSNIEEINRSLNEDLESLSRFCYDNELILNMKKGKSEAMLLGTAQRMKGEKMNVLYRNETVSSTERYTYLGNVLDPTLTLTDDFHGKYKKASKRMNLLIKMKPLLPDHAVKKIYTMMILPLITYCSNLHLVLTKTQQTNLHSLERRYNNIAPNKAVQIEKIYKRNACVMVRKCMDGSTCENFKNYFTINNHQRNTRNAGYLLNLPRIKLEFLRKSFAYSGAKLYNDLPVNIRKERDFNTYLTKIHDFSLM